MRRIYFVGSAVLVLLVVGAGTVRPAVHWSWLVLAPLLALGWYDALQKRRAVLRNFPLIGHFRYLLETIRPEINQYFIESEIDGRPFHREARSVVYQRAKSQLDTVPFGTLRDVYAHGYEWISHSVLAGPAPEAPRIPIGTETCERPYEAALLNVSAMSFGSLSSNAIRALNRGAARGNFYHNTGEGGLSPYHLEGGDLVWQVGTAYFGCRTHDGDFDPDRFQERAARESVRMVELKLSQGAKPGHGGILPAAKITPEIAEIRDVPLGRDVVSPPSHRAFQTPRELVRFTARLRELAGGKPVGWKLCVGHRSEFLAMCMAMLDEKAWPDYIAVDGGEGGTGAAPLEFTNSVGMPLDEGLSLVHNALVGFGLRDRVRIVAAGKITTGFAMASRLAMGADLLGSARGMMFALGCIQARRCNSNHCPVGVATQSPGLVVGLDVEDKAARVARFQAETVEALMELLGAAGLDHPDQLRPWHVHRRVSRTEVRTYSEIFDYLEPGSLLAEPLPDGYGPVWRAARILASS